MVEILIVVVALGCVGYLHLRDERARARTASTVVRFAGAIHPQRRDEYSAELHAIQRIERASGFDYAIGTLFGAAVERADGLRRSLVIRNVSKSYGSTVALRDVSLRLESGSITALMGGNGAGKSTLLCLLAGETAVQDGSITFGDIAVSPTGRPPAGIAVLHRDHGLIEDFTVATNIAFGHSETWLVNGRRERNQAAAALDAVTASIDPERLVSSLSPAERIQVLLAREVHHGSSELLVLDEPTAGIADAAARQVYTSIEACRSLGYGVIFVSHRIDQVFRVADRVAVLYDGTLVHDSRISDTSIDQVLAKVTGTDSVSPSAFEAS